MKFTFTVFLTGTFLRAYVTFQRTCVRVLHFLANPGMLGQQWLFVYWGILLASLENPKATQEYLYIIYFETFFWSLKVINPVVIGLCLFLHGVGRSLSILDKSFYIDMSNGLLLVTVSGYIYIFFNRGVPVFKPVSMGLKAFLHCLIFFIIKLAKEVWGGRKSLSYFALLTRNKMICQKLAHNVKLQFTGFWHVLWHTPPHDMLKNTGLTMTRKTPVLWSSESINL